MESNCRAGADVQAARGEEGQRLGRLRQAIWEEEAHPLARSAGRMACRGAMEEPSDRAMKWADFMARTERTKPLTTTLSTGCSGFHSSSAATDRGPFRRLGAGVPRVERRRELELDLELAAAAAAERRSRRKARIARGSVLGRANWSDGKLFLFFFCRARWWCGDRDLRLC